MGCPGFVIIGNNLKFSICTHDPDTGILTDADAIPTYRIYEDATETAILSGNMDSGTGAGFNEFDDANTDGHYAKVIACTAANGFENGKTYTVYIEATVDGDTGGICYEFTAYSQLGGVAAGAIEWTYTVTDADTGALLDGVAVWVTTDSAGTNVIASGITNDSGVVTFHLDAGTRYIWRSRAGYNFTNPDTEVIA